MTDYDKVRRRENEADLPRRLGFLTPERTAAVIALIERARPVADNVPQSRVCDYTPWETALKKVEPLGDDWPRFGRVHAVSAEDDLRLFAHDVSRPGWPEDHAHLVDFAFAFLEADVMLFRSGYTKRHLLVRLRQARLSEAESERARRFVRTAVVTGTGLEEFREVCRLARRILNDAVSTWLTEQANGAYITMMDIDRYDRDQLEAFDPATLRKLARFGFRGNNYAVRSDFSLPIVKTSELTDNNKVRVNAWRVLRHIDRVSGAERNRS